MNTAMTGPTSPAYGFLGCRPVVALPSLSHCVLQRLGDTFVTDFAAGAERLSEETDPKFLEHPGDLQHGRRIGQFFSHPIVLFLQFPHSRHPPAVTLRILPPLFDTTLDGLQIPMHVGKTSGSNPGHESWIDQPIELSFDVCD